MRVKFTVGTGQQGVSHRPGLLAGFNLQESAVGLFALFRDCELSIALKVLLNVIHALMQL
jgi:hypothetical protein